MESAEKSRRAEKEEINVVEKCKAASETRCGFRRWNFSVKQERAQQSEIGNNREIFSSRQLKHHK